ncbi:hypothetical protein CXB51_000002 [Gossypium anomalum]|uniref:DUF7865 domain-containing protein n=1 Tax=Gossypium anomalum TaxID=47600 RepID=A0A8J6DEJ2_9ROSI|nr:hypothetical protein CXB51_000002 [Gossypium anomalum]
MSLPGFFILCMLHSMVAITCGALMVFYTKEVSVFGHGHEIASKLQGSTPHDQLLIQTSQSFSGLLLFTIGLVLFMVAFVEDREFQSFFAKGCVLFGGFVLKESLKILPISGLGKLLGISCCLFLGFCFLLVHGGRSMIKGLRNERQVGFFCQNAVLFRSGGEI